MEKTMMVCLVSEQHVPNFLSIKTLAPDQLILVTTEKTMNNSKWLKEALNVNSSKTMEIQDDIFLKVGSIGEMNDVLKNEILVRIKKNSGPTKLIINITGGNKPMSTAGFLISRSGYGPCEVIYVDVDHPKSIRSELENHRDKSITK